MAKRVYTNDERQAALEAVERLGSISAAAAELNVPRKTVSDWVAGLEDADDDDGGTVAVAEAPSFVVIKESIFPEAGSCQENPPPSLADATATVEAPATDGFTAGLAEEIKGAATFEPEAPRQLPSGPVTFALDPFDTTFNGLTITYDMTGRCLISTRSRQVSGQAASVVGAELSGDRFTELVRPQLRTSPQLLQYRAITRQFLEVHATLASLNEQIAAATHKLEDLAGFDIDDSEAVMSRYREELRLRQQRQQRDSLAKALEDAQETGAYLRERAIIEAQGTAGAARHALTMDFKQRREELRLELDRVSAPLLAELAIVDSAWHRIPTLADIDFGRLVDALAQEPDDPPAPPAVAEAPAAATAT